MKIYLHDNSSGFRLCLFGDLNQPAAVELERCWRAALSIVDGRKVVVDGTGITSIQDDGARLLGRMTLSGVRVTAERMSAGERLLGSLGPDLQRTDGERRASLLARAGDGIRRLWCA